MRAILHIGPMKTGSTAVQGWLGREREALADAGIAVPKAFPLNASRIAALALAKAASAEPKPDDARRLAELAEEVAGQPPGVHSMVISGEIMGQGLRKRPHVAALKALLAPIFDDFMIVTYLRRQDELAVSMHSTRLRRGDSSHVLPLNPFDYDVLLTNWAAVFGTERIRPRIFDRTRWRNGSIVSDFAALFDFEAGEAKAARVERNPSLRPEAQVFLARLAPFIRRAGYDGFVTDLPAYRAFAMGLDRHFSGQGELPTREEARAFMEKARDSNERVRAAWFPEETALFNDDFSRYPETAAPPPSAEALLDVALTTLASVLVADGAREIRVQHRSGGRGKRAGAERVAAQ